MPVDGIGCSALKSWTKNKWQSYWYNTFNKRVGVWYCRSFERS